MYQVIIIIHVLLGLSVIGFVLIQQGKGADAGAAFGSASSGSVFGAQGASSFLSRTTAILATLFFATSLGLAIIVGYDEGEVDLMDTPDVEGFFADLPLVNDGEDSSTLKSIPVITDDVPKLTEEDVTKETQPVIEPLPIKSLEEASTQINAITNEIPSTIETKVKATIEDSKATASEEFEKVIETEIISE